MPHGMAAILRVPPENPFLWQGSLLDHEIDQVLRGRYQVAASLVFSYCLTTNKQLVTSARKRVQADQETCLLFPVRAHLISSSSLGPLSAAFDGAHVCVSSSACFQLFRGHSKPCPRTRKSRNAHALYWSALLTRECRQWDRVTD